jgi:tRNA A-37 threonylcarbamoyl transferase component Bud32
MVRIGRYHVEAKLGEGGMAETWLCRLHGAKGFSKRVVVKTLKAESCDAEYQTMFADEARVGARLDHPNIPRVLEFGETQGVPYLVQEYVEGPSVFQILQRQKLRRHFDVRLGCRIVADIALALDHAYRATDEDGRPLYVIHRDVSPSNVLVSRKGLAKLIDFGVAMFEDRETRTQTGVLKGKLRYMAPEVLLRDSVSHQSDLYSLGILLYGLVVGEPAWSGTDEVADRLRGHVEAPSTRRPELSPALDAIVLKCLAVDPTRRYASGRELAEELGSYMVSDGGAMTDHQMAEQIADLFPDGPRDWLSGYDLTATSLPTRQVTVGVSRVQWGLILGVVSVLATASVGLLAVIAASTWYLAWRPSEPVAAVAEPEPIEAPAPAPADLQESAATVLLDAAELALGRKDTAEAANQLRAAAAISLSDPTLMARRERLVAALQVDSQVRATRELVGVDPELALERTLALDREFPGQPEVAALLTEVRRELERHDKQQRRVVAAAPPAPVPDPGQTGQQSPPLPLPVPEPSPAGLLDPFGEAAAPGDLQAPFQSDQGLQDPFHRGAQR